MVVVWLYVVVSRPRRGVLSGLVSAALLVRIAALYMVAVGAGCGTNDSEERCSKDLLDPTPLDWKMLPGDDRITELWVVPASDGTDGVLIANVNEWHPGTSKLVGHDPATLERIWSTELLVLELGSFDAGSAVFLAGDGGGGSVCVEIDVASGERVATLTAPESESILSCTHERALLGGPANSAGGSTTLRSLRWDGTSDWTSVPVALGGSFVYDLSADSGVVTLRWQSPAVSGRLLGPDGDLKDSFSFPLDCSTEDCDMGGHATADGRLVLNFSSYDPHLVEFGPDGLIGPKSADHWVPRRTFDGIELIAGCPFDHAVNPGGILWARTSPGLKIGPVLNARVDDPLDGDSIVWAATRGLRHMYVARSNDTDSAIARFEVPELEPAR